MLFKNSIFVISLFAIISNYLCLFNIEISQSISQRTEIPNLIEVKKYEDEKHDNKIIITKYKTTHENVRERNRQQPNTSQMFAQILHNLNENRGIPPAMNQKI